MDRVGGSRRGDLSSGFWSAPLRIGTWKAWQRNSVTGRMKSKNHPKFRTNMDLSLHLTNYCTGQSDDCEVPDFHIN
jgi:hypothetical protein